MSDRYIIRTTGQTGPGIEAHLADTVDAHDASAISFSATGNLSSTDVQAAIAEVDSDLTAHTGDTSDAHDASAISVLDTAGNYTATDVEGVLAELPSRYGRQGSRLVQASTLFTHGHSYVSGAGASDAAHRMANLIAAGLGLDLSNTGVAGAALSVNGTGSCATLFLQPYGTPAARKVPNRVHVAMFGINDLNSHDNTAAGMYGFKLALAAAVSRLRATQVWEDSDASVSYGGTWSTGTSTTGNSGPGYHYTTSGAATYTITTPSTFQGGTVAIGIQGRTESGAGAIHTATYDGDTFALDVRRTWAGSQYAPAVLRVPDVAAGEQTISVALSSLVTLTAFDYWQVEPDSGPRPLVVLLKQPYPVDYSGYDLTPPGPPTDAGVDVLNTIIDDVAAQFDDYVITVDTSSLNKVTSMFAADKLHPSDAGHAALAALVVDAIADNGFIILGD